ncbi:MAG: DUF3093 family protein [Bryobacteraceae bacterium]
MARPIIRFSPSRTYAAAAIVALAASAFSVWCGIRWNPAFLPAALLFAGAIFAGWLATRPAVEIFESYLKIGDVQIPWLQIHRVDRTGWVSPLAVHLTMHGGERFLLLYPGDLDSANSLLRHLRRSSREALLDGVPYRQFWGEVLTAAPERKQLAAPKVPLLLPEDEAEVERMFQRLKSVGHLDTKSSADES